MITNNNEFQELKNLTEKGFKKLESLTLLGAKKVLTMNDASLLTGLSKSCLYKLVCTKKIPYYKGQGGKLTYFNKDEIQEWLLHTRVKPASEIETEVANYAVTGNRSKKGVKNAFN
ncbi:MAG: helix-turn-helix domain-containing protein [Prevotellaceae bacterium]|jgi:excisionase family DNA binding protein|nr:helix-turn-helix domain-containing protein [Prevotellaceae bacterium]